LEAEAQRVGLAGLSDISWTRLRLQATRYWELAPKWYGALGLTTQIRWDKNQSYMGQRSLGYGMDVLRGLEYYVIDGDRFALLKATIRRELLNFKVQLPIVPEKFSRLPIRLLAKAYGDVGYVHHKFPWAQRLNNRPLYTGGIGLDLVTFYDTSIRFEYSMNQLGEKGLFLHAKLDM
jgi:hypothetical protein